MQRSVGMRSRHSVQWILVVASALRRNRRWMRNPSEDHSASCALVQSNHRRALRLWGKTFRLQSSLDPVSMNDVSHLDFLLHVPRQKRIAAPMIPARNTQKSVLSTLAGPKSLIQRSPALPTPPRKTSRSLHVRATAPSGGEAYCPNAYAFNIRPPRQTQMRTANGHRSISVSFIAVSTRRVDCRPAPGSDSGTVGASWVNGMSTHCSPLLPYGR